MQQRCLKQRFGAVNPDLDPHFHHRYAGRRAVAASALMLNEAYNGNSIGKKPDNNRNHKKKDNTSFQ